MSERIFSTLTKTVPSEEGQGPVLGDGETIDIDVNVAGYQAPFSVVLAGTFGSGSVTKQILGLVGSGEFNITSASALSSGTPDKTDVTGSSWSRLRIRLVAGTPAPNARILVQVNGIPAL